MMENSSKENANPVIHSVATRINRVKQPLDPFERWGASKSSQDRAILKALSDARSSLSTTKSIMLETAGFHIPSKTCFQPRFTPSSIIRQQRESSPEVKRELIDSEEIFDIIRNIQDPEHPLTLEQLNVVSLSHVEVQDNGVSDTISKVDVRFTPTIPHCSMATLIGLCLSVKLLRSLPPRFKITVRIQPGTHASEHAINKQLMDKERVCAALENAHLLGVVNKCIGNGMKGELSV